jgi:hypothetical protein
LIQNKSDSIVNLAEGEFTAAGVSERNAESYGELLFWRIDFIDTLYHWQTFHDCKN